MSVRAEASWVAITQRRVRFEAHGEIGDYCDARWIPLLSGHQLLLVPNDLATACRALTGLPLDAVVLSGGNDLPDAPNGTDYAPERDVVEDWLLDHAEQHHTTVIGICRGAQALAVRAGAQLTDGATLHAGTHHRVRAVAATPWRWPETFTVASHHRSVLPTAHLPAGLDMLALADDDSTVEAFTHRHLPWWGLMWHPEREQPPGPAACALRYLLHTRTVRPT